MVTVSAPVASIPSKGLVLILEVPALPGLVALIADHLVTVVLILLTHLHSPVLLPGAWVFLSKPAPHGVHGGGGRAGRGEGGAAVVTVAHLLSAGAHCVVTPALGRVI